MELKQKMLLNIGFAVGVFAMCLINIILIATNRNQYLYDWWMLGISIMVFIICILFLTKKKEGGDSS